MSRLRIAAGNWKMHTSVAEGVALAANLGLRWTSDQPQMIIAPPLTHLSQVSDTLRDSHVKLAAQNFHPADSGAFTGEVSLQMLHDVGVSHVIIGHSERREIFQEENSFIREKVDAALANGFTAIFCCGEPLSVRDEDGQQAFVQAQLQESLFHLSSEQMQHVVVAYEPIWAIGTGRTASPEQAQEMHAFIRSLLRQQYGPEIASAVTILYGGSVKPGNAASLFSQPDVDGGLVGGASLQADGFIEIAQALQTSIHG